MVTSAAGRKASVRWFVVRYEPECRLVSPDQQMRREELEDYQSLRRTRRRAP